MKKLTNKTKEIHTYILTNVEEHPSDIASLTAVQFEISRQAAAKHVKHLVADGLLTATGATKGKSYQLRPLIQEPFRFDLRPDVKIEEDVIWRSHLRPLLDDVAKNVIDICQYGFTEMFNNAIEHSGTDHITVDFARDAAKIKMTIFDFGVGIFHKIQKELHLSDPRHALLELTKGKLTTDPTRHTGEGIFFTSRVCEQFIILSSGLLFTASTKGGHQNDWLIDVQDWLPEQSQGTMIQMVIRLTTQKTLRAVFDQYASDPSSLDFSRTRVPVQLAKYGEEQLVSRSQARRVLARFEKFREVLLDFTEVATIGHSFADEIFRVFKNEHPDIAVIGVNMTPQVREMIARSTYATKDTP